MTTVSLVYPDIDGPGEFLAGIQWTTPNGITHRAVAGSLGIQPNRVDVAWCVQNLVTELDGVATWGYSTLAVNALRVDNSNYRYFADGSLRVAPASEALNADGSVKSGYTSEYRFFLDAFGTKTMDVPFGIYHFLQEALIRKLNQDYPELALAMPE